jgi:hypothetical protein
MKPLNHKGQVLVLFLLLLPLFFLFIGFIIDYGLLLIQKHDIKTTKVQVEQYVKETSEIKEEDIIKLLENIDSLSFKQISIETDVVEIHIVVHLKTNFENLFTKGQYKIDETWMIERKSDVNGTKTS